MNKKELVIVSVIVGVVFGGIVIFTLNKKSPQIVATPQVPPVVIISDATSTPPSPAQPVSILPYGKITLRLGEKAMFKNYSLTPISVTEESRCPEGVVCVWAGTLKVKFISATNNATSTQIIELGKSFSTGTEMVTFLSATPYPKAGKTIVASDYIFTLVVTKKPTEVKPIMNPPKATSTKPVACYVGGCSGEICTDRTDMVSTCIYREQYACYKTAICERQKNGVCGWTNTKELEMCLTTTL